MILKSQSTIYIFGIIMLQVVFLSQRKIECIVDNIESSEVAVDFCGQVVIHRSRELPMAIHWYSCNSFYDFSKRFEPVMQMKKVESSELFWR